MLGTSAHAVSTSEETLVQFSPVSCFLVQCLYMCLGSQQFKLGWSIPGLAEDLRGQPWSLGGGVSQGRGWLGHEGPTVQG